MRSQLATSAQRISGLEYQYVREVLDSQFRSSAGSQMNGRLERAFAERFECRYAIAFVNGTATLHAALAAAGIGPGDEVIVPPLTMASTSFAVLHCGATPVFADIDPNTWTLEARSVEQRLTPRTKGIIPVSLYGLPPDMDPLMEICGQRGLFCLEDAAQCFLGYYRGRVVGSIGHAASFSFQSSKHITCGEGGIVTTNDSELADRIRRFNSLGYAAVGGKDGKITKTDIQDPDYQRHASIGYNYRMPELCAAVALAQLERLDELVDVRLRAAALLLEAMEECSWLIPQTTPAGSIHACWTVAARIAPEAGITWHAFRDRFRELGGDGVYAAWQLTYLEPAFGGNYARGLCPVAESVQPWLVQFKTNYWETETAARQAEILRSAIGSFR